METKLCLGPCAEHKSLDMFYRKKKGRDGLDSWCKKCCNARLREWQKKNPEKWAALTQKANKKRNKRLRLEALAALGGKCVECGFDDVRALEIDHIEGGGREHRRAMNPTAFHKLIIAGELKGLQILCCNHHKIKGDETGTGKSFRYVD